jgi:hypothetical protein
MQVAQSTTFSSAASELDDSLEGIPRRSHRGLLFGGLATLAVVAGGVFIARRPAPPLAPIAVPTPAPSSPSAGASAPDRAAVERPAPATNVTLRIEAAPRTTHLFRKPGPGVGAGVPPEDLGQVPVELSLPKIDPPRDYLLRAEGHKDRMVRVDPQHDHGVLRFDLEPAPALSDKVGEKVGDKKPRPPERKPAPKPIRRVPIHDADGLAVPSF